MTLSLKQVEHIAELAKLALSDEEKALFREQLSTILDHAARLQAIDTAGISPTATVLPFDTVLRDDEAVASPPSDKLLANAPAHAEGMFRVNVILD